MWNGDSSKNRPQHPMSRDSSHNGHYRPPPGYPEQPPHPYDVYAQAPYPPVDRGYDPRYHPDAYYGRPYPEPPPYGYPPHRHSSAESASAVQQQEASRKETPRSQTPPEPRGKPEAMAKAVAAAALDAQRKELEEERSKLQAEAVVEATEEEVVVDAKPTSSSSELPMMAQVVSQPPASPKPKKKARKPASKKSTATPKTAVHNELRQKQPPITDAEYQNLEALLTQFCRVPLLAEFSRPVTLLHPELIQVYSKIVSHPIDLGHICRGIRRRRYVNKRDVRLDMWRVFSNCVKFHSSPNNRHVVESFVSIALHLREYFNSLWNEFMLPSEVDGQVSVKRQEDRRKRADLVAVVPLSAKFCRRAATMLQSLLEKGGRVDDLDTEQVWEIPGETFVQKNHPDEKIVVEKLAALLSRLQALADEQLPEYSCAQFYQDVQDCYKIDVFEDQPTLRARIARRLERYLGKLTVPLQEACARGVTQSSVWGNIATTIWARENSKKPYWPGLVIGILPPEDRREAWHSVITERNESRLPEKLRQFLMTKKKACEKAQKRHNTSYFLVEFMGTHEFTWVRETDIVEKFEPNDDPNKNMMGAAGKKKRVRNTSTMPGSDLYEKAVEECTWATEEYEGVLEEVCEYDSDREANEGEDMNYSYSLLAQSDEEAEEEYDGSGYLYEEAKMSYSDIEEAGYLLEHDGLIDTSTEGRKNAKKRANELKKKVTGTKKEPSKSKAESLREKEARAQDRLAKQEHRDIVRRRKKRLKAREKALKEDRKSKKRRVVQGDPDDDNDLLAKEKRARATAIAKAYVSRMAEQQDYNSLGLNGVLNLPTAMVDSTGLLGLTLAFRAAAGQLDMPDETTEEKAKLRPWLGVDVDGPSTSQARQEKLERKIELIEKELVRIRKNVERRKALLEEAKGEIVADKEELARNDEVARSLINRNNKKKSSPTKSDTASQATDANDDPMELESPATKVEAAKGPEGPPSAVEVVAEPTEEIPAEATAVPEDPAEAQPVEDMEQ